MKGYLLSIVLVLTFFLVLQLTKQLRDWEHPAMQRWAFQASVAVDKPATVIVRPRPEIRETCLLNDALNLKLLFVSHEVSDLFCLRGSFIRRAYQSWNP